MNGIGNITKGISTAFGLALLMAFSTPVLDMFKVSSEVEEKTPGQIEEIVFDENCSTCKYITVYDEYDNLIYDRIVMDSDNIKDARLKGILKDSYFLMSNSITDFYILSN